VHHRSLRRGILNGLLHIRVLDSIEHGIKVVRFNDDLAWPNFEHRFLRRVFPFDLLLLGLFGLCPISVEDSITKPLLFRPFQRG
jgi:hypothetical protein